MLFSIAVSVLIQIFLISSNTSFMFGRCNGSSTQALEIQANHNLYVTSSSPVMRSGKEGLIPLVAASTIT